MVVGWSSQVHSILPGRPCRSVWLAPPFSMTDPAENLRRAREYLAAIEAGARGDALRAFYAPDVVQVEFPNRLTPKGATRRIEDILAAAERGREVLSTQRFEEMNAVAEGDRVALELQWTGTLAVPIGSIPVRGNMRARFALFLQYRDGLIAQQRNYDCFEPW